MGASHERAEARTKIHASFIPHDSTRVDKAPEDLEDWRTPRRKARFESESGRKASWLRWLDSALLLELSLASRFGFWTWDAGLWTDAGLKRWLPLVFSRRFDSLPRHGFRVYQD